MSTRIVLIVICFIFIIFLIGILVWGIVLGGSFYDRELTIVKEEQFDIADLKEISINAKSADIRIFRTTEEKIRIVEKANKKVKEKDLFEANISNDVLSVKGKRRNDFCIGFCFLTDIIYEIYIPITYENKLEIETTSGDIRIEAEEEHYSDIKLITISGDIEVRGRILADTMKLKTTSGDIEVMYLQSSSLEMNSVSGDITGEAIEVGTTSIKTTSGEIELNWLKGEVKIITVSGDIELDYANITGPSELKSTSGDIEMILDKNASVKMSGDSVSGDIRFPHSESVLGVGEHSLTFKTVSGDIEVRVATK